METNRSWARNKAKSECVCVWTNNHNYKTVHSEIKETKKLVNEESELELRSDFKESQELQIMYM
jgi:queuine/archaeosine tRNA-ribosyltransferase